MWVHHGGPYYDHINIKKVEKDSVLFERAYTVERDVPFGVEPIAWSFAPEISLTYSPEWVRVIYMADEQQVRKLLQNNFNINSSDSLGRTPLMIASRYQQLPIVKLLLIHKADCNLRDRMGRTALIYAKEFPEVTAMLKDAGAQE